MTTDGRSYAKELSKWSESDVKVLRHNRKILVRAMIDATFRLPDMPSVTEYANRLEDTLEKLEEIIGGVGNGDEGES